MVVRFFASNSRFTRLFQPPVDTCFGSPFFASLSVHGLHFTAYDVSRKASWYTLPISYEMFFKKTIIKHPETYEIIWYYLSRQPPIIRMEPVSRRANFKTFVNVASRSEVYITQTFQKFPIFSFLGETPREHPYVNQKWFQNSMILTNFV